MRTKATWLSGAIMMVALALAFAGTSAAQTTSSTVEMKDFEVIAVNGNKLVFRDQTGTREITVPDDFRFSIDGKKMAVSELKPGMKGTATVTTTSARFRDEFARSSAARSVDGAPGRRQRANSSGRLDKRGIGIVKDGKGSASGCGELYASIGDQSLGNCFLFADLRPMLRVDRPASSNHCGGGTRAGGTCGGGSCGGAFCGGASCGGGSCGARADHPSGFPCAESAPLATGCVIWPEHDDVAPDCHSGRSSAVLLPAPAKRGMNV